MSNAPSTVERIHHGVNNEVPQHPRLPTPEEHQALRDYNINMQNMVADIRNPLSLTNLAKSGVTAGFILVGAGAVWGTMRFFSKPDVVPAAKVVVK